MATADSAAPGSTLTPVAVVWCRQVDNEAESPGYTTIPEEFPGRRETLEAIRIVGNLTINIADTHDYWDPDPSQPLSFYPNIFLYPAANGRYTCVGRMFLSTEDRPRLGMKTLVLETAPLLAGGEFGADILRAYTTMSGRSDGKRPLVEPDPQVYQTVGEGFLFHRGTTEPVVAVAAEAWESSCQAVLELVRAMPTCLVARGAFLVFPYFLPEAKVNLHEFTEQFPLALAVMRVPRGEAQGDRHAKRLASWESAPVTLRDLTRPSRGREALPLVLQYVREHQETKILEVSRRVDVVEAPRLQAHLHDTDRQGGRDRRKEMWRIGTAMETAALLLTRPKGRSVPMTTEAAKRANEYLQVRPSDTVLIPPEPVPAMPPPAAPPTDSSLMGQHPPWLHKPPDVQLPPPGPVAVPVSTSDDPSNLPAGAVAPARLPPPSGAPPASPAASTNEEIEALLKGEIDRRFADLAKNRAPTLDPTELASRLANATRELEAKWGAQFDARIRELQEASAKAVLGLQSDFTSRLHAIEARPVVSPSDVAAEAEQKVLAANEAKLRVIVDKVQQEVQASSEMWATRLRDEFRQSVEQLRAQATHDEEEMRAALVAQIDLELREANEQGSALREEIEGRVRDLLKERTVELDQRRSKEVRDLEQRLGLLVDGRTKDLETRMTAGTADLREKLAAAQEERVAQAEQRWSVSGEARIAETSEAQTQALAGLQVRLQSYFEQKLRENQEREREKYVELLARLKSDVDQSLAKTIDSTRFDALIRDRVARGLEGGREEQEKTIRQAVGEAEVRLSSNQEEGVVRLERLEAKLQTRETDLLRLEQTLRHEVDDLDRRIQVVADRALPLIRRTWLRVSELEKEGPGATETEARLKELRREMARELRRLEGELLEQTGDLRDRLEATLASQGRIWINLMKQLQKASEGMARSDEAGTRRAPGHAAAGAGLDELMDDNLRDTTDYPSFASDPPNPLDPEAGEPSVDVQPQDTRRRTRRTT
ncbi:MAG TPA: hypothetical protein VEG66_00975 [Thermoplasmata archaeon]|jgi:hypothetical protein|nr:hypothetical protein [Thermoplasmata archaeon]